MELVKIARGLACIGGEQQHSVIKQISPLSCGNLGGIFAFLVFPNVIFGVHQATAYGKCVAATTTGRQELKKDLCAKEFEALKTCFTNAVS